MAQVSLDTATMLAVGYYNTGMYDASRQACDHVLASDPSNLQALILKVWLLRRAGELPQARDLMESILKNPAALHVLPRITREMPGPTLHDNILLRTFGTNRPKVSDISDHIPAIFYEAAAANPRLTVELGTRGGESTRALLSATLRSQGHMLSIDINNCSIPDLPFDAQSIWTFFQYDDILFGREKFLAWCEEKNIHPHIDVLFIDTSHLYEHTCQELAVWMPFVSSGGTVLFHDTYMNHAYLHNDGSIGFGWDNERGVIRAIEEYLGRNYDEKEPFVDVAGDWLVRHDPRSSGFTVLRHLGHKCN